MMTRPARRSPKRSRSSNAAANTYGKRSSIGCGVKLKSTNPVEAEADFRRAVDVARSQDARSLELRATMSLARLLNKQGKRDEARAMLAEIYNWFTEGFDTADLMDAKALIEELSASRSGEKM